MTLKLHKSRLLILQRLLVMVFCIFCFSVSFSQTNKGKDFWMAETPNLGDFNDFAISIANSGLTAANITITNPTNATVNAIIAPGTLQTFNFHTKSSQVQGTGIYTVNVYHVMADQDVVVFDFTPLVNSYTNDAGLVLPTNSLGKKYRPASYINPSGNSGGAFFGVVATQNATSVKTYNQAGTLVDNVTLNQGQYFQRNNNGSEITGWYIESDKPTAVFSGNTCTSIGTSTGACDHLDEQILPLESMASAYIAAPTSTRPIGCTSPTNCTPDIFRYVATEDGTVITTSPNVGGGTINKGQYLEISTSTPHIVKSNGKPFYGYQYLVSQNSGYPVAGIGDPSLLDMPPVDQFQFDYLFLIPNSFPQNFINVVAPAGTSFTFDGATATPPNTTVVGVLNGITYVTIKAPVSPGVHRLKADKQFGLIVSGFGQYASYAYIGGVGLQPINAGCNTGGPYQLTACSLSSIQLHGNATCSDGSAPTKIQWTSTDGVTFDDPNTGSPKATVPGYGTFNICLSVTCGTNTVQCCSQITVNKPDGGCNKPPVAVCKPVTTVAGANCNASVTADAFDGGSSDPEGGHITFSAFPAAPYSLGVTNVTLTVTDPEGATSTCTTTVTVLDKTSPVILSAPGDVTVECSAVPPMATLTATDYCDANPVVTSTETRTNGINDNNYTLTRVWTATDASGNQSTATQVVTVVDTTPPVISGTVSDVVVYTGPGRATCDQNASWIEPTATDNCSTVTTSSNHHPGDIFVSGNTLVTYTFADATGNTSSTSFNVTVIDNTPPVISTNGNQSVFNDKGVCGASVSVIGSATDNCSVGAPIGVRSDGLALNALYPVGSTTITWNVSDASGNAASPVIQTVVVTDNEKPVVNTKALTVYLDATGHASITTTDANNNSTDNCSISTYSLDKSTFDCSNVGNNTVNLTVTDNHNNSASAPLTVTVVDNIAPTVKVKPITVTLVNGSVSINPSMVDAGSFDNCSVSLSLGKSTFVCANIGDNVVNVTGTDPSGNKTTVQVHVTVVGEIPGASIVSVPTSTVFTGGNDNTLYLGYGAQSTTLNVIPTGASGNGSNFTYTYSWSGSAVSKLSSTTAKAPVFTPTAAGSYTFTVTVTNNYGCVTTASITICVNDIRVAGSNNKVYVCHLPPGNPGNPQTLSISVNAVPAHLGNHAGDKLGSCGMLQCGQIGALGAAQQYVVSEPVAESVKELTILASPNPSKDHFVLTIKSNDLRTPVTVTVVNAAGYSLDVMTKVTVGSNVTFGQHYKAGSYYAEVLQGLQHKVVKLIKMY